MSRSLANNIPCYGIQWPEAYEERAYKELNGFGTAKFRLSLRNTQPESVDYKNVVCTNAKKLRDETFSLFYTELGARAYQSLHRSGQDPACETRQKVRFGTGAGISARSLT